MSGLLSRSARIQWPDDQVINEEAFRYYGRLGRVQRYVEAHYSEALPLELAARLARLEKKYFSVFFHKKTGVPYSRWLAAVRVGKAIELMCRTDDSLTQVGHAVGFREFRTFQRTFKKLTGVTLREFRKQARSVSRSGSSNMPTDRGRTSESRNLSLISNQMSRSADPLEVK